MESPRLCARKVHYRKCKAQPNSLPNRNHGRALIPFEYYHKPCLGFQRRIFW